MKKAEYPGVGGDRTMSTGRFAVIAVPAEGETGRLADGGKANLPVEESLFGLFLSPFLFCPVYDADIKE
jgi:hypothetical protein